MPSLSRPQNVPQMEALAGGAKLVWCVPEGQAEDYRAAGAQHVFTGHPGIYEKINEVLDAHPDQWCLFSDDDCQGFLMLEADGSIVPITLDQAAEEVAMVTTARSDRFGCISMNQNQTFMQRTVTDWGQPSNWLCAIAPGTPERFRSGYAAEWDYAARIFNNYGRIARLNHLIGKYKYAGPNSHFAADHAAPAPYLRDLAVKYPHLFRLDGDRLAFRRVR